MRISHAIRTGLIALAALFTVSFASNAEAGEGYIEIEWIKGGWFIGISGGSGALDFGGQYYPLSIGGVSGGLGVGEDDAGLGNHRILLRINRAHLVEARQRQDDRGRRDEVGDIGNVRQGHQRPHISGN